ncbi:MAG TPA: hypothetical protein VF057_00295 [Thermoanaerobaculia bacterium]
MEEALRIALLAMITALAAEDLDRRLAAAEAEVASGPSQELSNRVDLLRYNRRVIEERDRILELSIANDPERAEDVLSLVRATRERRLERLSRSEQLVTHP